MAEEAKAESSSKAVRSYSVRAERSLKDADRTLKQMTDQRPEQRAMAQLEQAKVYALLQLADDIRQRG